MTSDDLERLEGKINLILDAVAEIYESVPLEGNGTKIGNKAAMLRELRKSAGTEL